MSMTREELLRKLRAGPEKEQSGLGDLDTDSISFGRLSPKKKDDKRSGQQVLEELRRGFNGQGIDELASSTAAMIFKGVNNITLPPARFLGSLTGDVRLGPGGPEVMSPETAVREQSPGGSLSIDREPQGPIEHGAEFAGETVALAGPFARALSYIPASTKTSLLAKAQNFVRSMGTSALKSPVSTLGVEGVAGFGAGAGGEIAVQALGDTPAVRFSGEILGGIAAPLPTVRMALAGRRYINRKMEPYSESGGSRRGQQRFERSVGEEGAAGLRGLDEPTTRDPATGEPVLSPAQRSGLQGPMALERSVMESSDQLAHLGDKHLAHANKVLQEDMAGLADMGTPGDAQEYLMFLFDTRLRAAAHRVEERISTLSGNADRRAANRIFDDELRRVIKVVNDQTDDLFHDLPTEAAVPTQATRQKYLAWKDEMGETGAAKIPAQARKFLEVMKGEGLGKNPQFIGETTSLGQLRNLQTSLREHARSVLKDSPASAKIANDIADAAIEDIAKLQAVPEVREKLQLAVDFSRDANAVLGKFKLGQMGGRSFTETNRRFAPELSAERSIGLGGPEGKQAYDQIIEAIKLTHKPADSPLGRIREEGIERIKWILRKEEYDPDDIEIVTDPQVAQQYMQDDTGRYILERMPETVSQQNLTPPPMGMIVEDDTFERPVAYIPSMLVRQGESADVIRDASTQYFRSRFLEEAVEGNTVNNAAARRFVKRHRRVIDALPGLRQEMQSAMREQKALDAMRQKTGQTGSAKVAKATMLIKKDPVEVFRKMMKTNPREVGKEMQSILNAVNKDELGFAQRGLKSAWVDFLFTSGSTGGRDIADRQLLSGAAIKDVLDSPQGKEITRRLFSTNKERQRIRTVVNDLVKLERRRGTAASKEGVLGDKPNTVLQKMLGFVGAGLGRVAGRAAGTGGTVQQPGYGASLLRELGEHRVRDPALRTIFEGIADEGLWRNVMMRKLTPSGEVPKDAQRRLNAWAATILYEMGVQERTDPPKQENQEESPPPRFAPGY